ncbi:hypothetical protein Ciccas_007290 [Cichlidogyrus casuarinus]|uniref:Uncharacterized protein n=1 Tax=Cichlidogyrus casuarinus TaxID=1844966 RepID=A0ABD2Q5W0_9PLAT
MFSHCGKLYTKLMSGNLTFLENFWSLSKSDSKLRKQAIDKILDDLKNTYKEKQDEYLNYTVARLIKGLASIRQASQRGFAECLKVVLVNFSDKVPSEEIISLCSKHLYTLKTSSEKEEKALRLGSIYLIEVLIDSEFIPKVSCQIQNLKVQLSVGEIDAITNPLIKFLDSKRIGHLVVLNFIKVFSVTNHFVPKMIEEQLRFELTERVSANKILFLLEIFDKHKKSFSQAGIKPIKLSDKNLKILASALLSAHASVVLESIQYLLKKGLFEQFWTVFTKLVQSTMAEQEYTLNARRMFECLIEGLKLCPEHSTKENSFCFFNENVIAMFLENRKEHSKLFKVIAWFLDSLRNLPDSAKPFLSASLIELISNYPMLDYEVEKNQNRVIVRILERIRDQVDPVILYKWAASLFPSFLKGTKIGGYSGGAETDSDWCRMRLAVLNCIRVAAQSCVGRLTDKSSKNQFFELCNFLVMVALAANVSPLPETDCCQPVTAKESQTAWCCLFAIFGNSKLDSIHEFLVKILSLIFQCLSRDSDEKFSHLRKQFDEIANLKTESGDVLQKLESDLHCFRLVLLLHAVYDSSVSDSNGEGILALIKDIGDCARIANLSKGLAKYKKPKKADEDPEWQLVLVDALIFLLPLLQDIPHSRQRLGQAIRL